MNDVRERKRWHFLYMAAYEAHDPCHQPAGRALVSGTGRPCVVRPAQVIAAAMIEALQGLDLSYPKIPGHGAEGDAQVQAALLAERPRKEL